MYELFDTINNWGKGSLFRYGSLETLCIIFLFLILAFFAKRMLTRALRRKQLSNERFFLRILHIIIIILCTYGCLSLLTPFDDVLSKMWGSAGILAVVIGLAAQESMGNFVNGILITTFKPFQIGDIIRLNNGEYEGKVIDISLRDTVIVTYENTRVIIPNSTINKAALENISRNDHSKGNFLYLYIDYDCDIEKIMQIIKEEVMRHPDFLDGRSEEEKAAGIPPVITRLLDFKDSSIELRTTVYSKTSSQGFAMLSDLRIAIKKRFDEEGITFPYPHRSIHIKNTQPRP